MPMMLAATPAATERAGTLTLPGRVGSDAADPSSTRRPGDRGGQVNDARVDPHHLRLRGRACDTPRRIEPAGVFATPSTQ
ncbi:MAG TPA: hypothetical protein VIL18_12940 [Longimicrobiales bacterium]